MPVPAIPAAMPAFGNRFSRALGRGLLRLSGWRVRGTIPDRPHLMLIGAPHTSNWDFVIACFALLALGLRITVMMKKEAFIWPLGGLFKRLGFIPIDRANSGDIVGQMTRWYDTHPQCWIGITPEGTRAKVTQWKSGFIRIAHAAQVPVLLLGLDYPSKSFVLVDELFIPSGNHEADIATLQAFYARHFTGKHPHLQ